MITILFLGSLYRCSKNACKLIPSNNFCYIEIKCYEIKYQTTWGSLHVQIFILTSAFLQYTGTCFAINLKWKKDEAAIFLPLSANLLSPALLKPV